MASSLGWHDPVWKQLYGPQATPDSVVLSSQPAEPGPVDYLDQLQQAAAAGVTFNLSDMPGYETNLQQPGHG
jgi:hypothetical protein